MATRGHSRSIRIPEWYKKLESWIDHRYWITDFAAEELEQADVWVISEDGEMESVLSCG